MSKYSYLNLIKMRAKTYAKANGLSLAKVHELAAKSVGFSDYHELSKVAAANPEEIRLQRLALSINNLSEALDKDDVLQELDSELEYVMSGAIADTNASMFTIGDIEVSSANWDRDAGFLKLIANLDYSGEQDTERPWCGTAFYLEAEIVLVYRPDQWSLHEDHGLTILSRESDRDRDHQDEMDYLAQSTE